jgi:hypothetical protein
MPGELTARRPAQVYQDLGLVRLAEAAAAAAFALNPALPEASLLLGRSGLIRGGFAPGLHLVYT